ncbi:extensin family protein [Brevibacillus massiliensis]|uniref:extensin family protein n=1 Tax=Brevibacillus massiliensis TaxID=1118054 RepID=UPI00137544DC|nr:extensin family protein [Brevibacillus massiliensis]
MIGTINKRTNRAGSAFTPEILAGTNVTITPMMTKTCDAATALTAWVNEIVPFDERDDR